MMQTARVSLELVEAVGLPFDPSIHYSFSIYGLTEEIDLSV